MNRKQRRHPEKQRREPRCTAIVFSDCVTVLWHSDDMPTKRELEEHLDRCRQKLLLAMEVKGNA